jgi:hypothetical protein
MSFGREGLASVPALSKWFIERLKRLKTQDLAQKLPSPYLRIAAKSLMTLGGSRVAPKSKFPRPSRPCVRVLKRILANNNYLI